MRLLTTVLGESFETCRHEKLVIKIFLCNSNTISILQIIIHTDQKLACLEVLLSALPEQVYSGPTGELEAVFALREYYEPLIHFVEQGEVFKHEFPHFASNHCDVSQ